LAAQVIELKFPKEEQVNTPVEKPPFAYPALHVTVTLCVVDPVMIPEADLSELAT